MKTKQAQRPDAELPIALRRYLYFSAAVTGGAIMIIEILGAKMLAPYIGTSHFVWTAQIAVTLVALAVGYYLGGRMVDRNPDLGRLYGCILAAAVYLCLTIAVVEPIAYWGLQQYRLALGSLLASALLFFIPLALLAMVGPFMARVLTASLSNVGSNIGRLTAVSTFGSFVGTVLIGYVLIPYLPNSMTMYLTAGLLMAIVAGYFFIWGLGGSSKSLTAAGIGLGLLLGYGGVSKEQLVRSERFVELHRSNSNFGLLQVLQNTGATRRFYLNDFLTQNTYDPVEKKSTSVFTYMLHDLAYAYTPKLDKVLCIGMGVGIVPRELANDGATVDVVEINPAVVSVASSFFDCDTNKFHITIGDGRYFVNQTTNRYDAIVLDAFLGESSPSHLMTEQAFQSMRRILNPDGMLVINSFGDFDEGKDFFTASLDKTLKSVFKSVKIHASGNGNVFFVASPRDKLEILHTPDLEQVHSVCRENTKAAFATLKTTHPAHGMVLTDNYNPVEFYDAPNREHWRRQLAMGMKDL